MRLRPMALMAVCVLVCSCSDDDSTGNENNQNQNNTHQVRCGDGITEGAEECDHGTSNSDSEPNACRTACTNPVCGDYVTDSGFGEECDDGDQNSDTVPNACRVGCVLPSCGDGLVDDLHGEECDDGNNVPGDSCSPLCRLEECGNSYLDPGEVCDDGNTTAGDGCSADCLSDETCGNGETDTVNGEECDAGYGCSTPGGCDIPPSVPETPTTDLEGNARYDAGLSGANGGAGTPDFVDLGAYEYVP